MGRLLGYQVESKRHERTKLESILDEMGREPHIPRCVYNVWDMDRQWDYVTVKFGVHRPLPPADDF